MENNIAENLKEKGEYTFLSLKRDPTPEEILILRRYARGDKSARTGVRDLIQSETEVKNLSPTCGRGVLNRILAGDHTYTGEINEGALGNGTTAFTNASTKLNNELFRKINSDSSFEDEVTYVDWFIETADVANQTFNEFAAFIDGSGTKDSGQVFSLVLTGGWVKSGAMFISLKVTLS